MDYIPSSCRSPITQSAFSCWDMNLASVQTVPFARVRSRHPSRYMSSQITCNLSLNPHITCESLFSSCIYSTRRQSISLLTQLTTSAIKLSIPQRPERIKILLRNIIHKLRRMSNREFLTTDLGRDARQGSVGGEFLDGADECRHGGEGHRGEEFFVC